MLYSCKSDINCDEIVKMSDYFWKKYYVAALIPNVVFDILLSVFMIIITNNMMITFVVFISYLLFCLVYCKFNLSSITTRSTQKYIKKNKINTEKKIEFYDDYLVYDTLNNSTKIKYSEIGNSIETDRNFYLSFFKDGRKKIAIIIKNDCSYELIQFIRNNVRNIENKIGDSNNFDANKIKKIANILTILSIISIFGGLFTFGYYNEINNITDSSYIKSSWLFWLWLPIPIYSSISIYKYYKTGINCFKNYIICLIICIFIVIYGLFSFMPNIDIVSNDKDYSVINEYKEYLDINLPLNGKAKTGSMGPYSNNYISNVSLISFDYENEDVSDTINDIKNNSKWIVGSQLSSNYKKLVPSVISYSDDIYYLFYNKTLKEYNIIPDDHVKYDFITALYDISKEHLVIYEYNFSSN